MRARGLLLGLGLGLGLALAVRAPATAQARPPGRLPPVDAEQATAATPPAPTYQVRLADLQRRIDRLKERIWRQPPRLPSYHPIHPDGSTSQGQRRVARLR